MTAVELLDEPLVDSKTCEHCGGTFERPAGTPPSRWEPRRYCDRLCALAANRPRRERQAKTCEHCGGEFERGRDDDEAWQARRYCCRDHAAAARRTGPSRRVVARIPDQAGPPAVEQLDEPLDAAQGEPLDDEQLDDEQLDGWRPPPPVRRGTSNGNARGSSTARRARRAHLLAKHGDGETCPCYRCGKTLDDSTITVDRIVPGCDGGTYRRDNIRPACGPCNSETGGRLGASRRAG